MVPRQHGGSWRVLGGLRQIVAIKDYGVYVEVRLQVPDLVALDEDGNGYKDWREDVFDVPWHLPKETLHALADGNDVDGEDAEAIVRAKAAIVRAGIAKLLAQSLSSPGGMPRQLRVEDLLLN